MCAKFRLINYITCNSLDFFNGLPAPYQTYCHYKLANGLPALKKSLLAKKPPQKKHIGQPLIIRGFYVHSIYMRPD